MGTDGDIGNGTGKSINLLGTCALACHAAQTLLSYVLAPAMARFEHAERTVLVHFRIVDTRALVGSFARNIPFLLAYGLPMLGSTLAFLGAFRLVQRAHDLDERALRRLRSWAVACACVAAPAIPVLVQDFWLSFAWGEMIRHGQNPYLSDVPDAIAQAMWMDGEQTTRMTYGPFWALVSGAIMWLAGGRLLVAAALCKLLFLGLWIAALVAVTRLTSELSMRLRCAAVVMFGWLPLSIVLTMGEGHNDIVMVAGTLWWLALLPRAGAPVLLALATVTKYVSAPIAVIDVVYAWRRMPPAKLVLSRACAALVAAACFVPFLRSREFFGAAGAMRSGRWNFLEPTDVVRALQSLANVPLDPLIWAVRLFFPALALHQLYRYGRDGGDEQMRRAVLAMFAAVLFGAIGHVWPWFVLWCLAPACLVSTWWVSRFVVGVALVAPVSLLPWFRHPTAPKLLSFYLPALGMYGFAIAWAAMTRAARRAEPLPSNPPPAPGALSASL